MNMFLHLLSRMYSSSTFYAQNPALEIVDQQKSVNVYLHMYHGNVQQKNPLCAASCVTKNISPRFSRTIFCRDANAVILRTHLCTAVACLYAKTVFEIVYEESVKVYHLHMYNGNIQQNPLVYA